MHKCIVPSYHSAAFYLVGARYNCNTVTLSGFTRVGSRQPESEELMASEDDVVVVRLNNVIWTAR